MKVRPLPERSQDAERGATIPIAQFARIDPKTGEKKWDYRMASPSTDAGVMTTASDVLFSGGRDGSFFALDARDGKLLWQTNIGPSVMSGPMTYSVDGNQYVSVVAGNVLFTFGLR